MVYVVLEPDEIREAARVGIELAIDSLRRTPRWDFKPGEQVRAHIMGACAEAVFHKYTGWPWNKDPGTFRNAPDVGPAEVKWCGHSPPTLKVYAGDTGPSVLVTGDLRAGFIIHGWIDCQNAPLVGRWTEGMFPCWWVEADKLLPIDNLVPFPAMAPCPVPAPPTEAPWGLEA